MFSRRCYVSTRYALFSHVTRWLFVESKSHGKVRPAHVSPRPDPSPRASGTPLRMTKGGWLRMTLRGAFRDGGSLRTRSGMTRGAVIQRRPRASFHRHSKEEKLSPIVILRRRSLPSIVILRRRSRRRIWVGGQCCDYSTLSPSRHRGGHEGSQREGRMSSTLSATRVSDRENLTAENAESTEVGCDEYNTVPNSGFLARCREHVLATGATRHSRCIRGPRPDPSRRAFGTPLRMTRTRDPSPSAQDDRKGAWLRMTGRGDILSGW